MKHVIVIDDLLCEVMNIHYMSPADRHKLMSEVVDAAVKIVTMTDETDVKNTATKLAYSNGISLVNENSAWLVVRLFVNFLKTIVEYLMVNSISCARLLEINDNKLILEDER